MLVTARNVYFQIDPLDLEPVELFLRQIAGRIRQNLKCLHKAYLLSC